MALNIVLVSNTPEKTNVIINALFGNIIEIYAFDKALEGAAEDLPELVLFQIDIDRISKEDYDFNISLLGSVINDFAQQFPGIPLLLIGPAHQQQFLNDLFPISKYPIKHFKEPTEFNTGLQDFIAEQDESYNGNLSAESSQLHLVIIEPVYEEEALSFENTFRRVLANARQDLSVDVKDSKASTEHFKRMYHLDTTSMSTVHQSNNHGEVVTHISRHASVHHAVLIPVYEKDLTEEYVENLRQLKLQLNASFRYPIAFSIAVYDRNATMQTIQQKYFADPIFSDIILFHAKDPLYKLLSIIHNTLTYRDLSIFDVFQAKIAIAEEKPVEALSTDTDLHLVVVEPNIDDSPSFDKNFNQYRTILDRDAKRLLAQNRDRIDINTITVSTIHKISRRRTQARVNENPSTRQAVLVLSISEQLGWLILSDMKKLKRDCDENGRVFAVAILDISAQNTLTDVKKKYFSEPLFDNALFIEAQKPFVNSLQQISVHEITPTIRMESIRGSLRFSVAKFFGGDELRLSSSDAAASTSTFLVDRGKHPLDGRNTVVQQEGKSRPAEEEGPSLLDIGAGFIRNAAARMTRLAGAPIEFASSSLTSYHMQRKNRQQAAVNIESERNATELGEVSPRSRTPSFGSQGSDKR